MMSLLKANGLPCRRTNTSLPRFTATRNTANPPISLASARSCTSCVRSSECGVGLRKAYAYLATSSYLVQDGSGLASPKEQILAGVDPRIPCRYSPELRRVVRTMLSPNVSALSFADQAELTRSLQATHRPSTEELMRMTGVKWGMAATTADKE